MYIKRVYVMFLAVFCLIACLKKVISIYCFQFVRCMCGTIRITFYQMAEEKTHHIISNLLPLLCCIYTLYNAIEILCVQR